LAIEQRFDAEPSDVFLIKRRYPADFDDG